MDELKPLAVLVKEKHSRAICGYYLHVENESLISKIRSFLLTNKEKYHKNVCTFVINTDAELWVKKQDFLKNEIRDFNFILTKNYLSIEIILKNKNKIKIDSILKSLNENEIPEIFK